MLRELDGTVRYLSIREAALVQGFPQDYEFPGVRSRVMGVIGNAVAVDVAAQVGRTLISLRAERPVTPSAAETADDAGTDPVIYESAARAAVIA
jgi:hypothetical protein